MGPSLSASDELYHQELNSEHHDQQIIIISLSEQIFATAGVVLFAFSVASLIYYVVRDFIDYHAYLHRPHSDGKLLELEMEELVANALDAANADTHDSEQPQDDGDATNCTTLTDILWLPFDIACDIVCALISAIDFVGCIVRAICFVFQAVTQRVFGVSDEPAPAPTNAVSVPSSETTTSRLVASQIGHADVSTSSIASAVAHEEEKPKDETNSASPRSSDDLIDESRAKKTIATGKNKRSKGFRKAVVTPFELFQLSNDVVAGKEENRESASGLGVTDDTIDLYYDKTRSNTKKTRGSKPTMIVGGGAVLDNRSQFSHQIVDCTEVKERETMTALATKQKEKRKMFRTRTKDQTSDRPIGVVSVGVDINPTSNLKSCQNNDETKSSQNAGKGHGNNEPSTPHGQSITAISPANKHDNSTPGTDTDLLADPRPLSDQKSSEQLELQRLREELRVQTAARIQAELAYVEVVQQMKEFKDSCKALVESYGNMRRQIYAEVEMDQSQCECCEFESEYFESFDDNKPEFFGCDDFDKSNPMSYLTTDVPSSKKFD